MFVEVVLSEYSQVGHTGIALNPKENTNCRVARKSRTKILDFARAASTRRWWMRKDLSSCPLSRDKYCQLIQKEIVERFGPGIMATFVIGDFMTNDFCSSNLGCESHNKNNTLLQCKLMIEFTECMFVQIHRPLSRQTKHCTQSNEINVGSRCCS